jgi:hypothetical protein
MEQPPPWPEATSTRPRRALPRSVGLRRFLRRRRKAVALLLGGVVAISGGVVGLNWLTNHATSASGQPVPKAVRSALGFPASGVGLQAAKPGPKVRWVARPVSLLIPAIGVHTSLVHLGLTAQGTLQVPPTAAIAGWYVHSPRPGQVGSAIIAGHIDSLSGPGVFYRLHLLHSGDLVYIRRANGSLAVFRVFAVRKYPKTLFPTSKVYGPTPDPELHLITCGGVFDQATGSYLSNIVVFTSQVRFHHRLAAQRVKIHHRAAHHPSGHHPVVHHHRRASLSNRHRRYVPV